MQAAFEALDHWRPINGSHVEVKQRELSQRTDDDE